MIFFSWSTFNSHRYYLTFLFLENTYEHIPRAAVDRSKIRTVTNIAVRCFYTFSSSYLVQIYAASIIAWKSSYIFLISGKNWSSSHSRNGIRFKLMEKKRKRKKRIYIYTLIHCACAELNRSAVMLIPKAFMLLRGIQICKMIMRY